MTEASRRYSTVLSLPGSAPCARAVGGLATPIAFAGPRAPDPHAPPPRAATPSSDVGACLLIRLASASLRVTSALIDAAASRTPINSLDAGLLRLCAAFHDAHARCEGAPDDGQEWQVWLRRRWDASDAIEDMTPRTRDGRQAKAKVALVLLEEAADTTNEYERFILATLRDLAAGDTA